MSENLDLVQGLIPPPGTDLAELVRDDDAWNAYASRVASSFHPDCEGIVMLEGHANAQSGLDGIRELWRNATAPWAQFRGEVVDGLAHDTRVLWLVRNTMRRAPEDREITRLAAALWTIRDGRVARVAFYADRIDAIKALFAGD